MTALPHTQLPLALAHPSIPHQKTTTRRSPPQALPSPPSNTALAPHPRPRNPLRSQSLEPLFSPSPRSLRSSLPTSTPAPAMSQSHIASSATMESLVGHRAHHTDLPCHLLAAQLGARGLRPHLRRQRGLTTTTAHHRHPHPSRLGHTPPPHHHEDPTARALPSDLADLCPASSATSLSHMPTSSRSPSSRLESSSHLQTSPRRRHPT